MKPSPKYDFPINVSSEAEVAPVYAGIYDVTLNHSISISFIPALDRSPLWLPILPDDVDAVRDAQEARRTVVALASLSVSPDSVRAGTEEQVPRLDGTTGVVFYVAPNQFDVLVAELEKLVQTLSGIHDPMPVSQLDGWELARLLHERILASGHLSAVALRLLDRGDGVGEELK